MTKHVSAINEPGLTVDEFVARVNALHPLWGLVIGEPVSATESRARAIRAVVAAQWIVACMLVDKRHPDGTPLMRVSGHVLHAHCATAEQIVDGAP